MTETRKTGDTARHDNPAGSYRVDTATSEVAFRAKAFCLMWVRGTLPIETGTVSLDQNRLHATGQLSAARIATGIGARDWHLRSSHYLAAKRHPSIAVEVDGATAGPGQGTCRVTVRGTTADIPLRIDSFDHTPTGLRITASGVVDRSPFPMLPKVFGVSRHVDVTVTVHAAPATA